MPIYEYRYRACGQQFEKLVRTFEPGEVNCAFYHSLSVERLLSSPLIRMGKSSESTSEFTAEDAEVNYYKNKKDYDRAAKAVEKAGKSGWEVKDLYCQAGKKT